MCGLVCGGDILRPGGELAESGIKRTADISAHQLAVGVYFISLSVFSEELMAK